MKKISLKQFELQKKDTIKKILHQLKNPTITINSKTHQQRVETYHQKIKKAKQITSKIFLAHIN